MYTELLNIIYTYVFNYKEPDKHFLEDVLDIAINKDNLREYIKKIDYNKRKVKLFIICLSNTLSKRSTANNVVISKVIGNSFFTVSFFTIKGCIKAEAPSIKSIFKILLPITLPSTISNDPESNPLTLTANSGALVPKATIVSPISIFDTLKFFATLLAPSTNISAPFISTINPPTNKIILIIM